MHLLRTVVAAACAVALCAPQVGRGDALVFKADLMKFDDTGAIETTVGERLEVEIRDSDPRRSWALQSEYLEPVGDGTKIDAAIIGQIVGGRPTGDPGIRATENPIKDLEEEAAALAERVKVFLTASKATTVSLERIQQAVTALDAHKAQLEARPPAKGSIAPALKAADEALELARRVAGWCDDASKRRHLTVTVHQGFRRVAVRACYQQLELGADKTIAPREPVCSRSAYELVVNESASGPRVTAGVLVPIYGKKPRDFYLDAANGDALTSARRSSPTGDPQAAIFVSARKQLGRSPWGVGPEVGIGVGDRLGQVYSLGVTFDYWGVGLGVGTALDTKGTREAVPGATTGTAMDRTRVSSLVSWYVRIGFSSELWDAVSRATGTGGPVNVPQKPPEPTNSTGQAAPEK